MQLKMKAPFRVVERKRPKADAAPGVPRVARLMALAIRFDQLLRDGVVRSHAELAALESTRPAWRPTCSGTWKRYSK